MNSEKCDKHEWIYTAAPVGFLRGEKGSPLITWSLILVGLRSGGWRRGLSGSDFSYMNEVCLAHLVLRLSALARTVAFVYTSRSYFGRHRSLRVDFLWHADGPNSHNRTQDYDCRGLRKWPSNPTRSWSAA